MLATRDFVFIHMPKTGGEFIGHAIKTTCDVHEVGKHAKFREMPEQYRGLPAITYVRNPWDWYVSYWHWRCAHNGLEMTFEEYVRHCFKKTPDRYTWIFGWLVGIDGCRKGLAEKARFEYLREDFIAFLDRHEIENDALRHAIRNNPAGNVTEARKPYREYYDDELREIVGTSRMARHYEF